VNVAGWIADRILGPVVSPPPELPPGLLPPDVTLRRGRLIPAIGGMLSRLGGPAAGVALRSTVVIHPDAKPSARLVAHELAHVRQWRADPLFPVRYTLETLRRGYRQNRYEKEARAAETAPPSGVPSTESTP
jgi:hypothetical protein